MRSVGNLNVPSLGKKRRQLLSRPIWADVRASVDEHRRDVKIRDLTEQRGTLDVLSPAPVPLWVHIRVCLEFETSDVLGNTQNSMVRLAPCPDGGLLTYLAISTPACE